MRRKPSIYLEEDDLDGSSSVITKLTACSYIQKILSQTHLKPHGHDIRG